MNKRSTTAVNPHNHDDMGNIIEVSGVAGALLLDRSGSMGAGKESTMEAFNGYFSGIKNTKDMTFSLHTFDTDGFDTLVENAPVKKMVTLSDDNYQPRGGTNLYDSIGRTILMLEAEVQRTSKRALLVIQTDGQENSSQEYTKAAIKNLIERKTEEGWQFVFLGVGINAMDTGGGIGIPRGNTITYTYNQADMDELKSHMVGATMAYAASACGGSDDFTKTDGAGIDMTQPLTEGEDPVSITTGGNTAGGNHCVTDDILSPNG